MLAFPSIGIPAPRRKLLDSREHARFGIHVGRIGSGSVEAHELGDPATTAFPNDIAGVADERLWFLEAHHQPQE